MNQDSLPQSIDPSAADMAPWYGQFWPWFLIVLPACSVAAGITLLIIAITHADDTVADDWYKQGRGINRDLEQENLAHHLGIHIHVQDKGSEIQLTLSSNTPFPPPAALEMQLRHPTLAEQDQQFTFTLQNDGHYKTHGLLPSTGQRNLMLTPSEGHWQLNQRVALIDGQIDSAAAL